MNIDEYLCQSLKCSIYELEDCLDFQNENGYLLDEIRLAMKNYAIVMCQKQKEICAEEAETKDLSGPHQYEAYFVIDKDSILNSPLPKELQDEN